MPTMTKEASAYIDRITPEYRPLFDRLHCVVLAAYPDVDLVLAYKMPTYQVGRRRLHVGVWKHGLSLDGWQPGRDAGFAARHPTLKTSPGTTRISPEDAAAISDHELTDLVRAALDE